MKNFILKHGRKVIAILAVLALALTIFILRDPRAMRADFGSFSGGSDFDFSSDYDYDFGGGGSDWDSGGSDWSSNNSDWNDNNSDWDSDNSDNWDAGQNTGAPVTWSDDNAPADGYQYGYGAPFFIPAGASAIGIIWLLVIIAIFIYVMTRRHSTAQTPVTGPVTNRRTDLKPMSEYTALDPAFDEAVFKEKLSNLYIQMQQQWTKKDISSLRPYFTDMMYAQIDRQLESFRKQKMTNYVDNIAVLGIDLMGWKQQGDQDQIVAIVRARIIDYTKSDVDGRLISGSETQEKFMTYEYTLTRTTGLQTEETPHMTTITCPHCGAPVDLNQSAKCPYCGSVLTVRTHDFVISQIQGISQRS